MTEHSNTVNALGPPNPVDSGSALTVLARRWWVSLVGLFLTLVGVAYAVVVLPITYKATGSLVLIAPGLPAATAQATGDIGAQNPLLGFNDALEVDASILITVVGDPASRQLLQTRGATASFALAGSVDGFTPLVQVTATSTDPAAAEKTVAVVLGYTEAVLAQRQAAVGAPVATYIHASPLAPPGPPTKNWKRRIEFVLIIALAGLLLTYIAALSVDRMMTRRGRDASPAGDLRAESVTDTEVPITEPNVAEPSITGPRGADPSGTEPSGTEPSGTEPNGTEPNGTEPGGTGPAAEEPAQPAPTPAADGEEWWDHGARGGNSEPAPQHFKRSGLPG